MRRRGDCARCGLRGRPGILVVAGTGSNAIGRTDAGEIFGAGGWGPVLGDEGSGTWIGLEAIRAALRAHDRERLAMLIARNPASTPLPCCARSSGTGGSTRSENWSHTPIDAAIPDRPAPEFASLAPIVARCAEQGDALAVEVLNRAGVELAELAELVLRKMAAHPRQLRQHLAAIGVAYTGGVLTHIAPVRAAMTAQLAVSLPLGQCAPVSRRSARRGAVASAPRVDGPCSLEEALSPQLRLLRNAESFCRSARVDDLHEGHIAGASELRAGRQLLLGL